MLVFFVSGFVEAWVSFRFFVWSDAWGWTGEGSASVNAGLLVSWGRSGYCDATAGGTLRCAVV